MIESVADGDVLEAQYWPEGKHSIELRDDPLLPVIFQDDWLIIVNKPAGMVTHPTYLHEKGSVTDR
jgi:23S rRNA pseudouridine1911/1915/1917 synthase